MQEACDIRSDGNGWHCTTCGGGGIGPEPISCVAEAEPLDPPMSPWGWLGLIIAVIASIALMIWVLRLIWFWGAAVLWAWLTLLLERLVSLVYLIGGWAP